MSTDATLAIFVLISMSLGIQIGYMLFKALHQCPPLGISAGQREVLKYVKTLLTNYHAAHKSSPLTNVEIEEILQLCKAEIDKVLED